MASISLNLPDSIHDKIREIAGRGGFSVEQFVASAAVEKLDAMVGADYVEERAPRGSREALKRVLDRVPHAPPDPGDELEQGA